jgi:hypothetical protein
VGLLVGLGVLAGHLHPTAVREEDAALATRLAGFDWAHAADIASAEVARQRRSLGPALLEGEEEALAQLLRLQAESAQLALGPMGFRAGSREDGLRRVELTFDLSGAYYDLPIFLDGLYRQRHLVEVDRVTVEARGAQGVWVACHVEAHLFRPAPTPATGILAARAGDDPGARTFAEAALRDVAALVRRERFLARAPALQERCAANHHLVMRTLPRLVRRLANSPLTWAGATFEGGQAQLTTEVAGGG